MADAVAGFVNFRIDSEDLRYAATWNGRNNGPNRNAGRGKAGSQECLRNSLICASCGVVHTKSLYPALRAGQPSGPLVHEPLFRIQLIYMWLQGEAQAQGDALRTE